MNTPLVQCSRFLVIAALMLAAPIEAQTPWSTLLGGADDDRTYAVARDAAGFVYVAGHTLSTPSTTFPTVTPGVYTYLPAGPTGWNLFVCKLNPAGVLGSQLVWSTIIGGSGDDEAFDIALDPSGDVTVTGRTSSFDFDTASVLTPYDTTWNGGNDAFLLTLSSDGTTLLYSTFLGGSGNDYALAIRDSNGILTLAGCTSSIDFPTNNAFQPILGGMRDVFVAQIDPNLGPGGLLYSTYLGGSMNDGSGVPNAAIGATRTLGVQIDAQGVIMVAGLTTSSNFPITLAPVAAYQTALAGGTDAFVTMLNPTPPPGTPQLAYSTYLGAPGNDGATSIDRIGSNRIVVGGYTYSGLYFPVTVGAYDASFNGTVGVDDDAFLAVLDVPAVGLSQLAYSTFIGGTSFDAIQTLAADESGAVVFGGFTSSANFPTTAGAIRPITLPSPSLSMGVIGRLNPAGMGACDLEYSTFFGGSTAQQVTDIALDPNLGVHVSGMTASTDFPTSVGAYQAAYGGGARDAWTGQLDLLPSGNLPGGEFFGAIRYGFGAPTATANGPVMLVGDGPAPGSSCFSVICRRAPATAGGVFGFTFDLAANPSTVLDPPLIFLGAAIWLNPLHPTFTLLPVASDTLGGCVVPIPLTGLGAPLGLQVVTQFFWGNPITGALEASDVLQIYI